MNQGADLRNYRNWTAYARNGSFCPDSAGAKFFSRRRISSWRLAMNSWSSVILADFPTLCATIQSCGWARWPAHIQLCSKDSPIF